MDPEFMEQPEDEQQEPQGDPEIKTLKETIAGLQSQLQTLASGFNAVVADQRTKGQPVQPDAPKFREVTDEELETALEEGEYKKYNALLRERERKRDYELQTRYQSLQEMGINRIGALTEQIATRDLPHYTKYKDEIEGLLQGIPAEQRMQPETYQMAYKVTLANHMDELIKEEVAKQLQQHIPDPGGAGNVRGRVGGRQFVAPNGQQTTSAGVPQPSREAMIALESQGYTPDTWAQRMGYESWAQMNAEEGAA